MPSGVVVGSICTSKNLKKRPKKGQIVGQNFNIGLMGNSEPV